MTILPVRLVVSPRNLRNGLVELKGRREEEAALVERGQVVEVVGKRLGGVV